MAVQGDDMARLSMAKLGVGGRGCPGTQTIDKALDEMGGSIAAFLQSAWASTVDGVGRRQGAMVKAWSGVLRVERVMFFALYWRTDVVPILWRPVPRGPSMGLPSFLPSLFCHGWMKYLIK